MAATVGRRHIRSADGQPDPIPFTEPTLGPDEERALVDALRAGRLTGDGAACRSAEARLRVLTGARWALLTTSCTHALELALMALDLEPGSEVIVPSFTMTSTATAILRQGLRPVFVDIEDATFNVDLDHVEAAITPATRAVMPIHYAGQSCDMDRLLEMAHAREIKVVSDAAQGIGSYHRGRHLGTIADIGCFSFHTTKNIVCGEGGALVTDDEALARRAEIGREKGTNRAAFMQGLTDKYTWVGPGSSFVLSDLLASVLEVQLGRVDEITARRRAVWDHYYEATADLEARGLLRRPIPSPDVEHNAHAFPVLVDPARRTEVIGRLRDEGITATFHYVPLHSSPYMAQVLGDAVPDLPVTDRVASSLLRLPLFAHLTIDAANRVVDRLGVALDTADTQTNGPAPGEAQTA